VFWADPAAGAKVNQVRETLPHILLNMSQSLSEHVPPNGYANDSSIQLYNSDKTKTLVGQTKNNATGSLLLTIGLLIPRPVDQSANAIQASNRKRDSNS
jgi:hypothetical protein